MRRWQLSGAGGGGPSLKAPPQLPCHLPRRRRIRLPRSFQVLGSGLRFLRGPRTRFLKAGPARRFQVLGGLKVGKKRLFVYHGAALQETTPDCVLDFYVHESCQRLGIGKLLLDVRPAPVAPSPWGLQGRGWALPGGQCLAS